MRQDRASTHWRAIPLALVVVCWSWACSPGQPTPPDGDGDADGDTDADGDADTDADGDADGDGDGDADGDADADGDDGDADTAPTCEDGQFGEICAVQADCCPGLVCYSPPEDPRPSVCTEWCDGTCPEGWGCQVFNDGTGGDARVCWYPESTLCNACEESSECGEVRDLCIGMPTAEDDTYCSILCDPTDPEACPSGFSCVELEREISTFQCMPDDGVCCVDQDGDGYGRGGACAGLDCNDFDPSIHPGADEVCDGEDNDCDGGADNDLSACGLCRQCVDGACEPVPEGEDPLEECPSVSCDGYFWGWEDATHTCYRMGDVPAALATCDGDGACHSREAECLSHGIQGPSTVTCEGTIGVCQEPTGCEGTTAGTCVNQDLGSETCGEGECRRTVERCIGGLEQVCTPGTPTDEACNDLDDDCDGLVDVSPAFAVHSDEPNEGCGAETDLGTIAAPATGVSVPDAPRIYPGGDNDYYRFRALEPTDAIWDCIPVVCRERYSVTLTITRPPDGADFELCASASSCGSQSCTTGDTRTLEWTGTCGGDDDRDIYFSVRSTDGSSFDCHAYDVEISIDAWLEDASWPGCPGA